MTLAEYATKWQRPADNNFAVACYNQNSLEELRKAKQLYAEEEDGALLYDCAGGDMDTWGITASEEWYDAICAALMERQQKNTD